MIRPFLIFSASAVMFFSGLVVAVHGVQASEDVQCAAPRLKGPPGSCSDCKDALKRLTYTQD